jgi:hypothetical protein
MCCQHNIHTILGTATIATIPTLFLTLVLLIACNMNSVYCPDGFDMSDDYRCWIQNHTLSCDFDAVQINCPIYANVLYSTILAINLGILLYVIGCMSRMERAIREKHTIPMLDRELAGDH